MVHRLLCSRSRIVCLLTCVTTLLVVTSAFFFPFVVTSYLVTPKKYVNEQEFLKWATFTISDALLQSQPSIRGLSGLVYGSSSINPSSAEDFFPRFEFVAKHFRSLDSFNPHSFYDTLFVAPDGVITEVYPPFSSALNINLRDEEFGFLFPAHLCESNFHFQTKLLQTGDFISNWTLMQLLSIYNGTAAKSPFWGVSGVFLSFDHFLQGIKLAEMAEEAQIDYLVTVEGRTALEVVPVASSVGFSPSTSSKTVLQFIYRAQTVEVRYEGRTLFDLFVRQKPAGNVNHVLPLTWSLCTVSLFLTVFLSIILALLQHCGTSGADDHQYSLSPRSPPFALLIIGPRQGGEMWSVSSEELLAALEKEAERFHAHKIPQLQPNTSGFLLSSVDEAVLMTFSVMRLVQQRNTGVIDFETELEGEAHLITAAAVHWCTEVECLYHHTEGFVQYGGSDIAYGMDLYGVAVGNAVTLSEKAKDYVSCVPPSDIYVLAPLYAEVQEVPYYVYENKIPAMQEAFMYAQYIENCNKHSILPITTVRSEVRPPWQSPSYLDANVKDVNEVSKENFRRLLQSRLPTSTQRTDNAGIAESRSRSKLYYDIMRERQQAGSTQSNVLLSFTDEENQSIGERAKAYQIPQPANPLTMNHMRHVCSPVSREETEDSFTRRWARENCTTTPLGKLSYCSRVLSPLPPFEELSSVNIDFFSIPAWLERALKTTYERHTLSISDARHWNTVSFVIYYFYFGYALLFQPLAPRERENITQCLARAFGVPLQGLYEYMAVHCALEFTQIKNANNSRNAETNQHHTKVKA